MNQSESRKLVSFYRDLIMEQIPMKDPYIIVKWHVSDIGYAAPYLTHEEKLNVLQYVYKNHDPEYGINWQVIEDAIEHLKCEAEQCKK